MLEEFRFPWLQSFPQGGVHHGYPIRQPMQWISEVLFSQVFFRDNQKEYRRMERGPLRPHVPLLLWNAGGDACIGNLGKLAQVSWL